MKVICKAISFLLALTLVISTPAVFAAVPVTGPKLTDIRKTRCEKPKTVNGLPGQASKDIPLLLEQLAIVWPEFDLPSALAAQVEQESHWRACAELLTSREYGFGYGQVTLAYDKNGALRFNNFEAIKRLDKSLAGWTWDNRHDARYGLRALVVYDRFHYRGLKFPVANSMERKAMMFSVYNGGLGGLLQDRRICQATKGCDPSRWFGHIEKTSAKAKVAQKGYGKSFFEINREYVKNILVLRRQKYVKYTDDLWKPKITPPNHQ